MFCNWFGFCIWIVLFCSQISLVITWLISVSSCIRYLPFFAYFIEATWMTNIPSLSTLWSKLVLSFGDRISRLKTTCIVLISWILFLATMIILFLFSPHSLWVHSFRGWFIQVWCWESNEYRGLWSCSVLYLQLIWCSTINVFVWKALMIYLDGFTSLVVRNEHWGVHSGIFTAVWQNTLGRRLVKCSFEIPTLDIRFVNHSLPLSYDGKLLIHPWIWVVHVAPGITFIDSHYIESFVLSVKHVKKHCGKKNGRSYVHVSLLYNASWAMETLHNVHTEISHTNGTPGSHTCFLQN